MARHLITTPDQRAWKWDRQVLFLGEWCRLYEAREAWLRMDAIVAAPYGIEPEQKARDHAYIYDALLPRLQTELAAALNAFHKCQHSLRYWQILIGPWLHNYAQTIFNRYFTLHQALSAHDVSGTTVLDAPAYSLGTIDTRCFVWATGDEVWNRVLGSRLIRERPDIAVEVDSVLPADERCFTEGPAMTASGRDLKHAIIHAGNIILPFLATKHDALIINSYLPKPVEVGLQLALGHCPQLWVTPPTPTAWPDPEVRKALSLDARGHVGFERFVRMQIFDAIPSCFLEGYAELVERAGAMPWPKEPRFIFTSNSFAYDEVFKAYTGSMVEKGVPYFVGAHASIATGPYIEADNNSPESQTSDRYFTWGWEDDNPRNVPAFIFKTVGRKPRPTGPHHGGLLLVEVFVPHRKTHWDSYYEFGLYQEDQFRFVESLPAAIRERLTVRLHGEYKRTRWGEEERWRERSPATKLDNGGRHIRGLIAESRLIVHSYDSTGIPESLTLNIPTVCFWRGGFDHLFPRARPEYEGLRRAGIFTDTPEQAAAHIAQHWDDLSAWWGSAHVQEARQAFCRRFCRTEPAPIRAMKRLLDEACVATRPNGDVHSPLRTW